MPFLLQRILIRLTLPLLLASCAASVTHQPASLTADDEKSKPLQVALDRQVDIRLDTGYTRTLKAGSEWRRVGRIPQGEVYRPHNGIFTLEGAHIHEAWLVIADGKLAGFYLPVERGFSPVVQLVDLPVSSTRN